jgi:hypothetical protein
MIKKTKPLVTFIIAILNWHLIKSLVCAAYQKNRLKSVGGEGLKRGPDFNRAERLNLWEGLNPCGAVLDTTGYYFK